MCVSSSGPGVAGLQARGWAGGGRGIRRASPRSAPVTPRTRILADPSNGQNSTVICWAAPVLEPSSQVSLSSEGPPPPRGDTQAWQELSVCARQRTMWTRDPATSVVGSRSAARYLTRMVDAAQSRLGGVGHPTTYFLAQVPVSRRILSLTCGVWAVWFHQNRDVLGPRNSVLPLA